ncbi:MAG TPA: hypothetical protein VD887_01665 [Allosphingosinicella sp.]|nr:hypothetical protein [Allosphingosinicella sp.]
MKTFAIAAFLAGSIAAPAFAQAGGTVLGAPQFSTYANRGQCGSALAHERNRQRANPDQRGQGYQDLTGSEFNQASRATTRCEQRGGRYVVVYYANGFPQ